MATAKRTTLQQKPTDGKSTFYAMLRDAHNGAAQFYRAKADEMIRLIPTTAEADADGRAVLIEAYNELRAQAEACDVSAAQAIPEAPEVTK